MVVDKYAGGIGDGAQRRSIGREYVFCDAVGQLLFIGGGLSVVDGDAGAVEFGACLGGDRPAAVCLRQGGDFGPLQELVDGR